MGHFDGVKAGDTVIRMLGGQVPMEMKVTDVSENYIHCGDWRFDKEHGIEFDPGLGWGIAFGKTGSYLLPLGSKMPEEAAPGTVPTSIPTTKEGT